MRPELVAGKWGPVNENFACLFFSQSSRRRLSLERIMSGALFS